MIVRVLLVCLVLALPARADERMSESLTGCAAIMALPNLFDATRAGGPDGAASAGRAGGFRAAAIRVARAEGRADPEAFVAKMLGVKRAIWLDRGPGILAAQEYRDRTAYCRAIGADQGVIPSG